MVWVEHVLCMERDEKRVKLCSGNLKGTEHSEDLDVDGRTILEIILQKWRWKVWIGFIWFKTGTSSGLL